MRLRNCLLCIALSVATSAAQAVYTYDNAGRLTRVSYGAAGSVAYTYDAAGNLISRSVAARASSMITSVYTAGGGSDIAQNTFVVITGVNLVPATTPAAGVNWSSAPSFTSGQMPAQLNGVSVTVDGKPAYINFFCSGATSPVCASDQINVLTPLDNATGPVPVVVTSGATVSAPFTATLKAVAPAFLLFGSHYVAATRANGGLIGPATLYPGASTPAQPGEQVVIYAVGFGPPSAPLTAGSSKQSGSLPALPVCKIGTNAAAVAFAGLISPGLYQLNVIVPSATPSGDNPIGCTYGGSATPAGDLITVGQ
jgi:uncharacterized protein (TIGR03437 family)